MDNNLNAMMIWTVTLFYICSFDLSDKDNFFDSKTRSSIVSITKEEYLLLQLKIKELL